MDVTAVSVVYTNPFYAQNYTGTVQPQQLQLPQQSPHQHQIYHANYMVSTAPTMMPGGLNAQPVSTGSPVLGQSRPLFGDLFRFEDGGGDASGSLLLGQDDDGFCSGTVTGTGSVSGPGTASEIEDSEEQRSGGPLTPMSFMTTSTSSSCSDAANNESEFQASLFKMAGMNGMGGPRTGIIGESDEEEDDDATTMAAALAGISMRGYGRDIEDRDIANLDGGAQTEQDQIEMEEMGEGQDEEKQFTSVYPRTTDEFLPRLPMPRPCAFMNVGQEQYIIQPDTVFVLGMRLNVTKNDIIMFFGKLGLIKMDESTSKPKIFVYKNKLTGRSKGEATITYVSPYSAQAAIACLNGSKFMGQQLTVLPAYLSTRKGSVRFSYPRELNTADQQRRQRQQRWKPASDNWVCLACRNSNFVWRSSCNRCQASKHTVSTGAEFTSNGVEIGGDLGAGMGGDGGSGGLSSGGAGLSTESENGGRRWRPHKNDWPCGFCFNLNFWYRTKCNRCRAPRSEALSTTSEPEKERWELVVSQTSTTE
ncbi:uncharacterized protein Dana_GF18392 [Drosophila ananassae]|uniref:Uncharacterized protein n=1 Tax=Drosophila ananassae TaxID=7217 RepID=B3M116_DROAN|nr:RNA-binding protein FUS [Drosophila ananassae]EDV43245.2 uncharacterized protein Dana_GF18392 [Drosophila ananassae]